MTMTGHTQEHPQNIIYQGGTKQVAGPPLNIPNPLSEHPHLLILDQSLMRLTFRKNGPMLEGNPHHPRDTLKTPRQHGKPMKFLASFIMRSVQQQKDMRRAQDQS